MTTSVSAGVSALASGLRFDGERDKVVVSNFEFPTIGQIWHAQERRGVRVEHVPAEADGTIPLERFEEAIDEQTALVAVTHVCFRNGSRQDVEAIARLAHERGALVLVDAYQTVGSLPVDVRALDCDFLVAGVLKYLLGSAGLGFFFCRRELVQSIEPTATGWFADRDIFEMDIHDYSPAPTARRFEAGTPSDPADLRGDRGDRADAGDRDRRDRAARARAERAPPRRPRRARRAGRDPARARAERRAPLRPLERRRTRSSPRSRARASSRPHATTTCASRPIATTPPRTCATLLDALGRNRALLAPV